MGCSCRGGNRQGRNEEVRQRPDPLLYCHCAYSHVVPAGTKHVVLRALCQSGVAFSAFPDLCEAAAACDPVLQQSSRGTKVAACYPRGVRWLFARAGSGEPPDGALTVLNMREEPADAIIRSLLEPPPEGVPPAPHAAGSRAHKSSALEVVLGDGVVGVDRFELVRALLEHGYRVSCGISTVETPEPGVGPRLLLGSFADEGTRPHEGDAVHLRDPAGLDLPGVLDMVEGVRRDAQATKSGGWVPWFPVIDYARCTNCVQCLDFCLFGVFALRADGTVEVRKPDRCKTNCPACARVCPQVAIIFPKYKSGPLSGGEVIEGEAVGVDLSSLVGQDVYEALRKRSRRERFSPEGADARALEERRRCACTSMSELRERLDVPPEVFVSFSPADLARTRTGPEGQSREAPEEGSTCCGQPGETSPPGGGEHQGREARGGGVKESLGRSTNETRGGGAGEAAASGREATGREAPREPNGSHGPCACRRKDSRG